MAEAENTDIETFSVRDVTITVVGITPYSASRPTREKEKSESWDEYEAAVWQEKCHEEGGDVFIPGDAFKLSLDEAAQNLNEKIGGKGNQTWTGVMKMGVAALSNMPIGVKVKDLKVEKVFCHASGKRGPGGRVTRWFPIVHSWGGEVTLRIFNDTLTQAKFEEFFHKSGLIAGVGRGRPSTGCPRGNGRYRPTRFSWTDVT